MLDILRRTVGAGPHFFRLISDNLRSIANGNDVKREWRYLYEDSISVIWKKEYEEYQAKRGISEGWNALINEIRKYDNVKMYDFTNEEVQ